MLLLPCRFTEASERILNNGPMSSMRLLTRLRRGNLIRRVETLKKLGARTSKQMDQDLVGHAEESDDDETDRLSAPENEETNGVDKDDSTRH